MKIQRAIAGVVTALMIAIMLTFTTSGLALARDPIEEAQQTLQIFVKKDPSMKKFMNTAAGYVVFPAIKKGALAVGGAHGDGVLFERGVATAKASMTQVTIGLQAGGQSFAEVIFFENPKVLGDFKEGNFALAAQMSAVALSEGAAKSATYKDGIAVFTATNTGLMFEASVGGQKFNVKPLK